VLSAAAGDKVGTGREKNFSTFNFIPEMSSKIIRQLIKKVDTLNSNLENKSEDIAE